MDIDFALARLGALSPEPCLVSWYGDLGQQLNDAVVSLDYLYLRARFVKPVAAADVGGQGDRAARLNGDESGGHG
ncbi:MAG: hypothetical protein M0T77_07865 [Actinomycetota bacterium]|nr:hypothetical protein [Actinomycetota bacterium]